MIPVLVWGSLVYRKEYSIKDYAIAFTVMIGCTLFLVTGVRGADLALCSC